jgi:hypothetical protein
MSPARRLGLGAIRGSRGFTSASGIPIWCLWHNGKNHTRASRPGPRLSCARCSPRLSAIRNPVQATGRSACRRPKRTRLGRPTPNKRAVPSIGHLILRASPIAYDLLQPCVDTVVALHDLSAGRPCECRGPSPLASKVKKAFGSSAETTVRAAAMSAIALTLGSLRSQGRLIEALRI